MAQLDSNGVQALIRDAASLKRVVISGRRKSFHPNVQRIDIRPVLIREQIHLQVISHDGKKDITKNYLPEEFQLEPYLQEGYANILIEQKTETWTIRITKQGQLQVHHKVSDKKSLSADIPELSHDRIKARLLAPYDPIFIALGISDKDGKLIQRQSDKYRQVDDFLRIVSSVMGMFPEDSISVVDLGCGNAYLTFAVYRYLSSQGRKVKVVGVDNRAESRLRNEKIASSLGISEDVTFAAANIADFPSGPTDLVIALHACDTATDDAIAWAIRAKAQAILVSPCCHHELNRKIEPADSSWQPIFRHGIMRERFADLLTDSLRAEILKINGYKADLIEFVAIDHTPRNLLIRATYSGTPGDRSNYEKLCHEWSLEPYLEKLLS